jgi:hypothetical protein
MYMPVLQLKKDKNQDSHHFNIGKVVTTEAATMQSGKQVTHSVSGSGVRKLNRGTLWLAHSTLSFFSLSIPPRHL